MGFFSRWRGDDDRGAERALSEDAVAMRAALDRMQAQERIARGRHEPVDLRALTLDLIEGEVAAPTRDIAELVRRDTDARAFYEAEIAPSWEDLGEAQRAARLDGFLELARMADAGGAGLPEEMVATLRTKALLLAWAFDETYGYMARLAADADPA